MTSYLLCESDVSKPMLLYCKDSLGAAVDITGASPVTYVFKRSDGTIATGTGSVSNGPLGIATYTLQSGDILPGHLQVQLQVGLGGATLCSSYVNTTVLDDLA